MNPESDVKHRFKYHAPDEAAREAAEALAVFVLTLPQGREAALAITKIEEAMFWMNAAIARAKDGSDE